MTMTTAINKITPIMFLIRKRKNFFISKSMAPFSKAMVIMRECLRAVKSLRGDAYSTLAAVFIIDEAARKCYA
jgi:hypothetical protein